MLQNFFEHLINKTYQNFRAVLIWFVEPLPTASSHIKFGGWEMSYNWKGLTRTSKEVVGNIGVITKTIFFNYKYTLRLMGVNSGKEYDFVNFIHTIAHEIAHCILIDYDPQYLKNNYDAHNEQHQTLTEHLEKYLWTLPEIQELARLQKL